MFNKILKKNSNERTISTKATIFVWSTAVSKMLPANDEDSVERVTLTLTWQKYLSHKHYKIKCFERKHT